MPFRYTAGVPFRLIPAFVLDKQGEHRRFFLLKKFNEKSILSMAKRFTDTEIWDKEWFMKLSCKHKCLVKMVRDKADLCGVWSPNWIIASAYLGETVSEEELLNIDEGQQFFKLENGKIFCIGFIEFQYGELSEKSPVHRKILSMIQNHNLSGKFKKIGYKHPINRVQEEEEDKEKEKEEEKDLKGGTGENIKPFPDFPKPGDCGELPDIISGSVIELLRITKNVIISDEQVRGLWPVFLKQNVMGVRYFPNIEAVHSYFINWMKEKKFENGSSGKKSNLGSKSGGFAILTEAQREAGLL